jgi:hypothetical protein
VFDRPRHVGAAPPRSADYALGLTAMTAPFGHRAAPDRARLWYAAAARRPARCDVAFSDPVSSVAGRSRFGEQLT